MKEETTRRGPMACGERKTPGERRGIMWIDEKWRIKRAITTS
jgi:hypothetical protein